MKIYFVCLFRSTLCFMLTWVIHLFSLLYSIPLYERKSPTIYLSHSVKGHFELIFMFSYCKNIAREIPGPSCLVIMDKSFSKIYMYIYLGSGVTELQSLDNFYFLNIAIQQLIFIQCFRKCIKKNQTCECNLNLMSNSVFPGHHMPREWPLVYSYKLQICRKLLLVALPYFFFFLFLSDCI